MIKYRLMETPVTDLTVTLDAGTATVVMAMYAIDDRTGDRTRARVQTHSLPDTVYQAWVSRDAESWRRQTISDAPATKPRPEGWEAEARQQVQRSR